MPERPCPARETDYYDSEESLTSFFKKFAVNCEVSENVFLFGVFEKKVFTEKKMTSSKIGKCGKMKFLLEKSLQEMRNYLKLKKMEKYLKIEYFLEKNIT